MNAEQYIAKYLAGTMTESELILFRAMMDRSPEYRTQMRQVLDLRSLIHDDSLRLTPPEGLSERTRDSIAQRFAAAAAARTEHALPVAQERRKRGAMLPSRISAGALAMLILGAVTALTPENPMKWGRISPLADARNSHTAGSAVAHDRHGALPVVRSADHPRTAVQNISLSSPNPASIPVVPQPDPAASRVGSTPEIPVQTNTVVHEDRQLMSTRNIPEFSSPPAGLPVGEGPGTYPAVTASQRSIPEGPAMASLETPSPRIAFGVTVGSGMTTDRRQVNAMMQNAYYLTVNLSRSDRIGIETGFAAMGSVSVHPVGVGNGVFTKGTAGSPDDSAAMGGSRQRRTDAPDIASKSSAGTADKQISYGGIYYDRRFQLSRSWDICARAGVGGTDNAVVTSLRTYAAFAPSRNLKLTIGIGGTVMRTLDKKDASTTGNIGIYYGIETGF